MEWIYIVYWTKPIRVWVYHYQLMIYIVIGDFLWHCVSNRMVDVGEEYIAGVEITQKPMVVSRTNCLENLVVLRDIW